MIRKLKIKFFINAMIAFIVAMVALVVILNLFINLRFTETLDFNLDKTLEIELSLSDEEPDDDLVFRGFRERIFIVYYNETEGITETKISMPNVISEAEANAYALDALETDNTRGWEDGYRYLIGYDGDDQIIVFIDGDFFLYAITSFRNVSMIALAVTIVLVAVFLYFGSKKAIQPVVESHEKQKQFMTDASHELKTPITVISANTEILKMNDPENEWLESISKQTKTLTALIQHIIKMSKLSENEQLAIKEDINFKSMVEDVISDFVGLLNQHHMKMILDIKEDVMIQAEKQSMKEVLKILVDNAIKYGNNHSDITIKIEKRKKTHIFISNDYEHVDDIDFHALFNRFYRADRSRASDGSFGLGLSIAAAIIDNHQGQIKAYKHQSNQIMIEMILP
ncbi:HAMP domain-containing histidine kinase [Mycoplasmatota bacterium]|nr:HAMP domain-containing histidine kinase [Mycoplasmatota bacterium]